MATSMSENVSHIKSNQIRLLNMITKPQTKSKNMQEGKIILLSF